MIPNSIRENQLQRSEFAEIGEEMLMFLLPTICSIFATSELGTLLLKFEFRWPLV